MTNWIIPSNLKYYDVIGAFSTLKKLDWKQSSPKMQAGDYVYIYIGAPVKAIVYKCLVTKANLDTIEIDDSDFVIQGDVYLPYPRHMELELIKKYNESDLSLSVLRQLNLKGNIQGPRRMSDIIENYIAQMEV